MNIVVEHRGKKRKARGFSAGEIVEAKLSWTDCARLKLRMDPKRSTVYKENVKVLTELSKTAPSARKPKKTKAQRSAGKSASKTVKKKTASQ